jgi:hypothetical protein
MLNKVKTLGGSLAHKAARSVSSATDTAKARAGNNKDDKYLVALDIGTEFVKYRI